MGSEMCIRDSASEVGGLEVKRLQYCMLESINAASKGAMESAPDNVGAEDRITREVELMIL